MALSNYDIGYLVGSFDPAFSGLTTAIDQLDGIMMHINNGDISLPSFDKALLRAAKEDLESIHDILMMYERHLKTRKS